MNADSAPKSGGRPASERANTPYAALLDVLRTTRQEHTSGLALLLVDVAAVSHLQARLGFESSALVLGRLFEAFRRAVGAHGVARQLNDGLFAIIIGAVRNRGHAILAGEKLLRIADEAFAAADLLVKPALHVGISLLPHDTTDVDELVRHAQLALAAAQTRSVRLQTYDGTAAKIVVAGWDLRDAFVRALDTGELSVYFQPKIRTADGCASGVEALLRWLEGSKPVSTPDIFIPLAEAAGLIHQTTWYVLNNSLRLASECPGLSVAVNITPDMLHHREFLDMIDAATATWRVPKSALTLEITEGGLMVDFDQAHARLTKLRAGGVRISIDDFGTGYSSLSYFKSIPADELKIDKSFVMRMLKDPSDRSLVEMIISLARQFKLETVAEGVEDRATLEALTALGCDYVQGYLFSPAIDTDALKRWLAANPRIASSSCPNSKAPPAAVGLHPVR